MSLAAGQKTLVLRVHSHLHAPTRSKTYNPKKGRNTQSWQLLNVPERDIKENVSHKTWELKTLLWSEAQFIPPSKPPVLVPYQLFPSAYLRHHGPTTEENRVLK